MKKYLLLPAAIITLVIYSCSTNPLTNKKTLNFVSNEQLFPQAFQEYQAFLSQNKVISGTADARMVESVGMKIKSAAEKYLNSLGQSGYLKDYQWEYKLVQDPAINAWCMPGGKIVIYTGILPVTKDEAGLATVMGHEVAHALANHGAQRMSASQLQQLGAVGVGLATGGKSEGTQQLIMQAYGIGSNVAGMLPFSRKHETEADEIGLILMAIAGYNPDHSVTFWQRMSSAGGGSAPMEFLSTHPSDATRIANLQKTIPTAKAKAAKLGVNFK
jgi:predicted Zn-dependent protease